MDGSAEVLIHIRISVADEELTTVPFSFSASGECCIKKLQMAVCLQMLHSERGILIYMGPNFSLY